MDALLTPRAIAHRLGEGGGDDVMIVKGNQPQLQHDIRLVFQEPTALAEPLMACETIDHGHGRLEERRLTAGAALVQDGDWPGLAEVFQVERRVTVKKSGAQRAEVVYGVTSLAPAQAGQKGCRVWSGSTGRLNISSIGSAMSPSMRISPKYGAAAFRR